MHAHLKINGADLMLSDDFPEYHGGGETAAPSAVTLHLAVDDADPAWSRAVGAGAEVAMPLADQFWGDRYGARDRKSVVVGKSVSVRVDLGGCRINTTKK